MGEQFGKIIALLPSTLQMKSPKFVGTYLVALPVIASVSFLISSYFLRKVSHPEMPIVAYEMSGNEEGKPLVFIHGWPDLPSIWNDQIEHLKDDYLCISIELPNFNKNRIQNPWGYTLPNVVKGIANQIQYILQTKYPKYRQEGVTLIIHDWGSAIGQGIISSYPNLVSRAVIVDIGDTMPTQTWKNIIGILSYQGFNIFCFLLPSFIGNKLMRYYLYKFPQIPMVEYEKKQNEKVLHTGMNYLYFYAWKARIWRIITGDKTKLSVPKIPTFFVSGKWYLGPWHTEEWKQTLLEREDCEFKQYEDAKHWVMKDQCQRFNDEIKTWLDK